MLLAASVAEPRMSFQRAEIVGVDWVRGFNAGHAERSRSIATALLQRLDYSCGSDASTAPSMTVLIFWV